MRTQMTISIDSETAEKVRSWAGERGKTISEIFLAGALLEMEEGGRNSLPPASSRPKSEAPNSRTEKPSRPKAGRKTEKEPELPSAAEPERILGIVPKDEAQRELLLEQEKLVRIGRERKAREQRNSLSIADLAAQVGGMEEQE